MSLLPRRFSPLAMVSGLEHLALDGSSGGMLWKLPFVQHVKHGWHCVFSIRQQVYQLARLIGQRLTCSSGLWSMPKTLPFDMSTLVAVAVFILFYLSDSDRPIRPA